MQRSELFNGITCDSIIKVITLAIMIFITIRTGVFLIEFVMLLSPEHSKQSLGITMAFSQTRTRTGG